MFNLLGTLTGSGTIRMGDTVLGEVTYEIDVHEEVAIGMIAARGFLSSETASVLVELAVVDGPLVLLLESDAGEVTFGVKSTDGARAEIEVTGPVPGF